MRVLLLAELDLFVGGNDPLPSIGGDGMIVKFPDGTKVGVSTDQDGEPNGVQITKPIW